MSTTITTMRLLIATQNAKKRRELELLLAPLGIEIAAPADVGGIPEVAEDQPTFALNAAKKAVSAATASGLWTLADDSGLEVDALDGAPGVNSARYAGEPADDARNNAKLLEAMAGVTRERRGARFICALALARPDGTLAFECEGVATGVILHAPRGTGDFGYDPLFLFTEPGFQQNRRGFAELSSSEKAAVSHRGRALRLLVAKLPSLLPAEPPDET
jgi:XTP/dITP diphosphohydrolase